MNYDEITVEELLKENRWLKELTVNMPRRYISQMEIVRYRAGRKVIEKGSENPYIYILFSGNNRIVNEFNNGRVFEFSSTRSRETRIAFSGLLEFFSGNPLATSTVEASDNSLYLRMRKTQFGQWINEDFSAYKKVAKLFAKQLYPSMKSMGTMKVYSGIYSLANYLHMNYSDKATIRNDCRVAETREELSQELGISLRTVYRLCNEMVTMNLIRIEKKKIIISPDQINRIYNFLQDQE